MERNVRLYPIYYALFSLMAWLPIFFLFFGNFVTIEQILRLEALYYFAVVLIEVPSGYFSDRVGRRPTLIVSTLSMSAAYVCFLTGSSFGIFAVGQVLLAIGFGFQSGTDTSLHYDSLAALGREGEYGDREAIANRNSLFSSALGALLGGALGLVSLRYAYVVSLVGMLGAFVIAVSFKEPPTSEAAPGVLRQLRQSFGYLRQRPLAWLFIFVVLMTILNHIPYEFYQPYLGLLGEQAAIFAGTTPLIAGLVAAGSKFVGAFAAGASINIARRFGTGATLIGTTLLQTLVIGIMGLVLHPLIALMFMLRDVPGSLSMAPRNAAIAPRVGQAQRATYFSLQSLAGRFAFSMTLVGLSFVAGTDAPTDWPTLAAMLRTATLIAVLGLAVLLGLFGWVRNEGG